MRAPALLLLLLILLASPVLAEDDPALLAKRDACFVHALRAWPSAEPPVERVVAPGHVLLHTRRADGTMKRLIEPTGTVAINTRRISYAVARVLGVAADEERLYVLLWRSGRIYDRPPKEGAKLEGGTYELRTFWLEDGTPLAAPYLPPAESPEHAPEASLHAGPLKLAPHGVSCFGQRARYDGRKLAE